MDPTRFSRVADPNVMRVLRLFRYRKGLKKIPNKTVEYYIEDPSALSKRMYISLSEKQGRRAVDQLK